MGPGSGRTWRPSWWVCPQSWEPWTASSRLQDEVVQSHHPLKWEASLAAGAEDWDPELWAAVWGMQGELITSGIQWWWWWQGWKRSVWMPKRLGLRVSSGFLIAPLSAVFHLAPLEPSRSWLALPPACWAWNSSCPAGAGAPPESLQVCPCDRCHTSTCWVFKLCFLPSFVLSETFSLSVYSIFSTTVEGNRCYLPIFCYWERWNPEKLVDVRTPQFIFKVRRGPPSACFYSPGQVGSCQDSRIYAEKRRDAAFSS